MPGVERSPGCRGRRDRHRDLPSDGAVGTPRRLGQSVACAPLRSGRDCRGRCSGTPVPRASGSPSGGAHRGIWGGRIEFGAPSAYKSLHPKPTGATKGRTPMISERSRPRRFPGSGWAAVLLLLLALRAYSPLAAALGAPVGPAGSAAAQRSARSGAPQSSLGESTVQGFRQRHPLRAAVDHSLLWTRVSLGHDPYARWDSAVCPLVAGRTGEQGGFILARISRRAWTAHVPLAGSHCRANLFVAVTDRPRPLLRKRWAQDQVMYGTRNGIAPVRAVIASTRAVHSWYNTALGRSSQPLDMAAPANALAAAGMLIEGGQRRGACSRGRHQTDGRRHAWATGRVHRADGTR